MASRSKIRPNTQACLACRSKHLKCDGRQPICERCITNGVECTYVQSKRGHVGGRRKQTNSSLGLHDQQASRSSQAQIGPHQNDIVGDDGFFGLRTPSSDGTADVNAYGTADALDDHLLEVFYQHIHPAHPFIIPHKRLKEERKFLPHFMIRAMRFITRPFLGHDELFGDTFRDIFHACNSADGFQVQALLLLTIASYARGERAQGDEAIRTAIDTAFLLKLDLDRYVYHDDPIVGESWRRTWWELYCVAGVIRVLTPTTPRLESLLNKLLPMDDSAYNLCQPAASRTLSDMQDRLFSDDRFIYSAFAYRVEAVRILNDILDFSSRDAYETQTTSSFHSHRAAIRSYIVSLPPDKQNGLLPNGQSDELMFCGLTTINLASVLLNLPRSGLSSMHGFATICATKRPSVFVHDETATVTATGAADEIVCLLVNRSSKSSKSMSPCFSCVLAFAVTTHLMAYRMSQDLERLRCLREYIQVALSALDSMSWAWPIAKAIKTQLAEFVRSTFPRLSVTSTGGKAQRQEAPTLAPTAFDDAWLQNFVNTEMEFPLTPSEF